MNLGFGLLKPLKRRFGHLVGDHRTYALQTVQQTYMGSLDVRYFLKYPWLIPEHTRQPLDRWARATGRMQGWADVRCFLRGWWPPSPINSPIRPSFLTLFRCPQAASVCFMSVCKVFVCFGAFVMGNPSTFASRT